MAPLTLCGRPVSGRFTIPSGIVTVTLDTLLVLAQRVPQLGVLTTKSIGPTERTGNREPVFAGVPDSDRGFVNAVGLANPGCDYFAQELAKVAIPEGKFLLISIFGGSTEDFVQVARTLDPYAHGFELNFSCPHAAGHGQAICAVPGLAAEVLRSVGAVTTKPLFPKLSPNLSAAVLDELVVSLVRAGAAGFTAVNTVGPVENRCAAAGGENILSIGRGGLSGPPVRARGVEVVGQLAAILRREGAPHLPIIGMGGIATAADCAEFTAAGAQFLGVGTALTGLSTDEVVAFFAALDAGGPAPAAGPALFPVSMRFERFELRHAERVNDQLGIFTFDRGLPCQPGQFVEVWVPGHGEKPFAQAQVDPFTLVVRDVGVLTHHFFALQVGDPVFVRGPYGRGFTVAVEPEDVDYVLVGGGTGIAPLLLLARELAGKGVAKERIHVFLGGRDATQLYFRAEFAEAAQVHVATDDGSEGFHGFVTQLLEQHLAERAGAGRRFRCYNCGPELMMKRAFDLQRAHPFVDIECSIERYMKCGVGICGVCACDGLRMCVDGPVMPHAFLAASAHFGKCHRSKTTKLLEW